MNQEVQQNAVEIRHNSKSKDSVPSPIMESTKELVSKSTTRSPTPNYHRKLISSHLMSTGGNSPDENESEAQRQIMGQTKQSFMGEDTKQ